MYLPEYCERAEEVLPGRHFFLDESASITIAGGAIILGDAEAVSRIERKIEELILDEPQVGDL